MVDFNYLSLDLKLDEVKAGPLGEGHGIFFGIFLFFGTVTSEDGGMELSLLATEDDPLEV